MKINENKLKVQLEALERFKENRGVGSIIFPTGTGKSYLGKLIIEDYYKFNKNPKIRIIIPTNPLKNQWNEEYVNSLKEVGIKDIEVITIQAAIKRNETVDLLILDEGVEYIYGEEFSKVFLSIKATYKLLLYPLVTERDKEILKSFGIPVIFELSRNEAIERGLINPVTIYNLKLSLSLKEINSLRFLDAKIYEIERKLGGSYYKFLDEEYCKLIAEKRKLPISVLKGLAMHGLRISNKRRSITERHPKKIEAFQEVIKHTGDKQIITFSNTITFAKELSKVTGKAFYNSLPKKEKDYILDSITNKDLLCVNSVAALRRGIDKKFDIGFDTAPQSGRTAPANFIQKLGRVRVSEESKTGKYICAYMSGKTYTSLEEKKLMNTQKTLNLDIHEVNKVEDIFNQ